jgi:hypothetical protein
MKARKLNPLSATKLLLVGHFCDESSTLATDVSIVEI